MSDEIRARVVDHPLFNKVLLNQLPTEEEREEFAIGEIKTISMNASGVIVERNDEEIQVESKKAPTQSRKLTSLLQTSARSKEEDDGGGE